jgi:NADPH-dependent 2,4-dienoyl-CoA reductase/sulfur reductase-like enzyme
LQRGHPRVPLGGALGLAILATIATAATRRASDFSGAHLAALTHGYTLGFLVIAAISALGAFPGGGSAFAFHSSESPVRAAGHRSNTGAVTHPHDDARTPVLIAGAGPAGLAAASELAHHGEPIANAVIRAPGLRPAAGAALHYGVVGTDVPGVAGPLAARKPSSPCHFKD